MELSQRFMQVANDSGVSVLNQCRLVFVLVILEKICMMSFIIIINCTLHPLKVIQTILHPTLEVFLLASPRSFQNPNEILVSYLVREYKYLVNETRSEKTSGRVRN